MAQYQSFPGAPGDSLTLDKLKKLLLPDMEGRSFLDVGCNEGFFCGFAKFQGASRSVGVDHSAGFIARARQRFPDCEFHVASWEQLPQGPFDVILLASALHYADDQPALLHRLMDLLSPDGVLVLELGIVTSKQSEWVKVERGIDQRYFPTMPKLREVLADYAWKWMGPSIAQAGDPVSRHVLHVSRRRRAAYLLMQPPAFGKSSIAKALFPKAGVPVVSGDQVIGRIAAGKLQAPEALARAINDDYSPFRLDQAIQRIFDRGLGVDLVRLWLAEAGPGDFAVDMYVPASQQTIVQAALADAGYMPVVLNWDRVGASQIPEATLRQRAEMFYLSLADEAIVGTTSGGDMLGYVDEVDVADGRITLRGWAADGSGAMPPALAVRVGDTIHVVELFEKQLRPDVQRATGMPHALVGYRAVLAVDGLGSLTDLGPDFAVHAHGTTGPSTAFPLSAPLARKLKAR
jgi:ubiquinone/menaquinone biosynthesis C-methylase UbiE